MIRQLKLKNYKRFRDVEFNFANRYFEFYPEMKNPNENNNFSVPSNKYETCFGRTRYILGKGVQSFREEGPLKTIARLHSDKEFQFDEKILQYCTSFKIENI